MVNRLLVLTAVVAPLVLVTATSGPASSSDGPGAVSIVSVDSAGKPGTRASGGEFDQAISGDGQRVAFTSSAGLTPATDARRGRIYLRNLTSGTTRLVSKSLDGGAPNGWSWDPEISDDGGFVAYTTVATDIVKSDRDELRDVLVWNRTTGRTRQVTKGEALDETYLSYRLAAMSGTARYVLIEATLRENQPGTSPEVSLVVWNRVTNEFSAVPGSIRTAYGHPGEAEYFADISDNGRYAAFAVDLPEQGGDVVSGWDNRGVVRADLQLGVVLPISVKPTWSDGSRCDTDADVIGLSMSADGSRISYALAARHCSQWDVGDDAQILVWTNGSTAALPPVPGAGLEVMYGLTAFSMSDDGSAVAYDLWESVHRPLHQIIDSGAISDMPSNPAIIDGRDPMGGTGGTSLSDDGTLVVLRLQTEEPWIPEDTNGVPDVFLWDTSVPQ